MREIRNPANPANPPCALRGRVALTPCAVAGPGVPASVSAPHAHCLSVVQPALGHVTSRDERHQRSRSAAFNRVYPLTYGTCAPREAQSLGRIVGALTRLEEADGAAASVHTAVSGLNTMPDFPYETLPPF